MPEKTRRTTGRGTVRVCVSLTPGLVEQLDTFNVSRSLAVQLMVEKCLTEGALAELRRQPKRKSAKQIDIFGEVA